MTGVYWPHIPLKFAFENTNLIFCSQKRFNIKTKITYYIINLFFKQIFIRIYRKAKSLIRHKN